MTRPEIDSEHVDMMTMDAVNQLADMEKYIDCLEGHFSRLLAALETASEYGWIDGGHHKQWVIDQMLRTMLGDDYAEWIKAEFPEGDWDTGVAP